MKDNFIFEPIENRETINVNLQELFAYSKLDYTRLYVDADESGSTKYLSRYELTADDYLGFSKNDYYLGEDVRSRINAVTNAKRAIDCQIDNILFSLRYNFKKEPQDIIRKMLNQYCDAESIKALKNTHKLALISALNLSPMVLISETRSLRHSVEHAYSIPKSRDAKKAIEVAELFIGQTNSRRLNAVNFRISDTKIEATNNCGRVCGLNFNNDDDCKMPASLRFVEFSGNNMKEWVYELDHNSIEYWVCLRMAFSKNNESDFLNTFAHLLQIAKKNFPYDRIKIKKNDFY